MKPVSRLTVLALLVLLAAGPHVAAQSTAEARGLLRSLATGAAGARLTRDAQAALQRVVR